MSWFCWFFSLLTLCLIAMENRLVVARSRDGVGKMDKGGSKGTDFVIK